MPKTVRMLQSIAGVTWSVDAGETIELSSRQAEAYIRAGIAEPVARRTLDAESASLRPATRSTA
jgi:hypothetical protein